MDEEDIFNPVTPQQREGSFLDRPGVRSAILQASLQMLQPVPLGQSQGGAIAAALSQGGEAYRRSVGTNIAGRKQKADEVNTESLINYRGDNKAPGGKAGTSLTLSQRMKVQKDERKEWEDFLENLNADGTVDVDALLSDPVQKKALIDKFKMRKSVAEEATGQNQLMSSAQLFQDAAPQMAQLKQLLAAGDPQAQAFVARLKSQVADPEAIDAYLGGLSE